MAENNYILSLDQGTTSSRAIVFDHKGNIVNLAQKEFKQSYPKPGWVEHDPAEIWSTQKSVADEVLESENLTKDNIAAIGITNQRETVVMWDKKTGEPVYPAIVWQDRRTAKMCKDLKQQGCEKLIREKAGLLVDPYFSGTKIAWILDNVKGARKRAERGEILFGTIDSWLIWNYTGGKVHVTDVTNACRTLLFNIYTLRWDEDLLEMLNIPEAILPTVKSSSEVYCHVSGDETLEGLPIAGIAGDQHAALFGQACFEKGMAKNTYGTGCFLLMNTGTEPVRSEQKLLTTIAWKIGDRTEYALEGSIFIGGAVVQWLRDELKLINSASECDELAAQVEDSDGLFIVPAFTGLGAPHWDPQATGSAFGISRGTSKAHFCRAALESIGFQVRDLAMAQVEDSGLELKELRVDGGASRSDPLMQFQANLLQTEVIRPDCIETTALGAAYLAGLAVGYWESRDDIVRNWNEEKRFSPTCSRDDMQSLLNGWEKAVKRSLKWSD